MVWAQVKNYIKMSNSSFKTSNLLPIIRDAYAKVSPENWHNYVEHTRKIEDKMWAADELQDEIEEIVICDNSSSSSTPTSSPVRD